MEPTVQIAEGAASKDPEVGLRAVAALRALAERLELLQVQNARELGWSWQDIASHLGVTKQTVHRKYGRLIGEAMMFERFTAGARQVVVQAQMAARRLGHDYIGCEHLLLAAAATGEPAGAVLRAQGVTPERIEAEMARVIGRGYAAADPLGGLDREALAAIGIDLDVVRARIEAAFGPDALTRAVLAHKQAARACRRGRRPAWGKGPVARLTHRRRSQRGERAVPAPRIHRPRFPGPQARGGHIPFTPRAKKALELSLREALALKDSYIGVQHLALALLAMKDGTVPEIVSALGASIPSLRAAILDRYRKAS